MKEHTSFVPAYHTAEGCQELYLLLDQPHKRDDPGLAWNFFQIFGSFIPVRDPVARDLLLYRTERLEHSEHWRDVGWENLMRQRVQIPFSLQNW